MSRLNGSLEQDPDRSIQPLKPVRLTDQIVDQLRAHIADKQLRPGDTLPSEVELARRFGVGRPTVREAINSMAGSGLIQVTNGRAPVVGKLSSESLNRLFEHGLAVRQISLLEALEFRYFIEGNSVALAAENRTDQEAEALQGLLEALRSTVGDTTAFVQADIAFHNALATACKNTLVPIVIEGVAEVVRASSEGGLRLLRSEKEWSEAFDVHVRITDAVVSQDAEEAKAAMRKHYEIAEARLWRETKHRESTQTSGAEK